MSIFEYTGTEPKMVPAVLNDKILEIILKQLEIIKQLGTSHTLIEAGTKIKEVGK